MKYTAGLIGSADSSGSGHRLKTISPTQAKRCNYPGRSQVTRLVLYKAKLTYTIVKVGFLLLKKPI